MSRARFQDPPLQSAGKGKDAYWFVRFRVYREDGTSTRKQVTVGMKAELKSERAANKRKQEIIARETSQVPKVLSSGGAATFERFYRERFLVMKSDWSEAHRKKSIHLVEKHILPRFGSLPLEQIDKVMIQSRLNAMAKNYSRSTLRHVRGKLVEVLEEAVDQEFLDKNPASKTKIPEEARKPSRPVLSAAQLIQIIDKLEDPKDRAIFMIGTFCALRTSEVFGLPWGNFHHDKATGKAHFLINQIAFEGEVLEQTKNDASEAHVHISPETLATIFAWKEKCEDTNPEALMFPSANQKEKGAPMWPGAWLSKRLAPAIKPLNIGFSVNFRATRRTAATLLQDYGESLASAQAVLRHASPMTTAEVYTKPVPESVSKAVDNYENLVFGARSGVPENA